MTVKCVGGACHGQIVRHPDQHMHVGQTILSDGGSGMLPSGPFCAPHLQYEEVRYTRRVVCTKAGEIVFFAPEGMSDHSVLMFALS